MLKAATDGGYIFANYQKDAHTTIKKYDLEGNFLREVELPEIGTAWGFSAREDKETLFYFFTSSDYLTIAGGSNGGLLVEATKTQRPELARIALPAVGV